MESINQSGTYLPGQSIFLLGFMGTGKSTWGKKWAGLYNMPFLDLDELIEQATGSTVVDIFEKEGEDFFREKETEILKSRCNVQGHIISCGGGTPCFYKIICFSFSTNILYYDKSYLSIVFVLIV